MKKILRKSILILLSLGMILQSSVFSFAASKDTEILLGYYINVADLDAGLQKYISSIYLSNDVSGWALYLNGRKVGTKAGTTVTFEYTPNSNTYYVLTFNTSTGKASAYYKNTAEESVVSVFSFAITDAVQTVEFLSDPSAEAITKTASKNSLGIYDFGEYRFSYKGQEISFSLKVNSNTNKVIITRDGKDYTYDVDDTGKVETVYCENLVSAQEIQMDYMASSLDKKTYSTAKSFGSDGRLYTTEEVDSALRNYSYTLVNNKTGLSTTVPLQSYITHWARKESSSTGVGDGTYNEYTEKVQVVCQWGEDRCSDIRSSYTESGRPFAVYGTNTLYSYVDSDTALVLVNKYKNLSWPASAWSDAVSFGTVYSNLDKTYGLLQYRKAAATWGNYSSWEEYNSSSARTCSNNNACKYETRDGYAYQSRSWSDWSDYLYASCTESDESQCKSAVKYSQRTRSWGSWSGYTYTGTESLSCSSVGSALTSSACERESAIRYRKKTASYSDWSSWSSWNTSSCTSSSTKNCESKTVYAWRSMGSWSDWATTTLNVSCNTAYTSSGGEKAISLQTTDCKTETQYKKRTRSISNYTYSDFGEYKTAKYDWTAGCTSRTGNNSECGLNRYSYSDWGSKSTSKYGSYQEGCMSVYGSNSLCGVLRYDTTFGDYKDSKYGSYTSDCMSKTVNTTCNTYYTDGSKCGYEYGSWSAWSGYSTASCSASTTKECGSRTEYRSKTCSTYYTNGSKCGYSSWTQTGTSCVASCTASTGTTTKTECSGKYVASVGACKKGQYKKTTYSRTALSCAAAGCSSWGSWGSWGTTSCTSATNQRQCETRTTYRYRTRTATAQACSVAGCKTYNTKTQYSCPTSKTAVYKSCSLYECPSRRTAVYNSCTSYSCPHYRTTHYSDWSSWSDWSTTACASGDLVDCDSKVVNYKRTRSWNDWTGYSYTYGATSSTIDYKSQAQSRYQTRTLNWGDWTDYIYSSCIVGDTVQCDSATRWRVRYLGDWGGWSSCSLDSCTKSDTSECQSNTMYAKRSLGDWSKLYAVDSNGVYLLSSCEESATRKCYTQKQMRTSKRTLGSYGSWVSASSLDSIEYDENYGYQYRYNNGVYTEDDEKGTSSTVGSGKMYISTLSAQRKYVSIAVTAEKSYSVSNRMTASEITAFQTQLGNDAAKASALNGYIAASSTKDSSGNGVILMSDWENTSAINSAAGSAAVSRFLNEKRFIPYIFITRHYRAVNAKFNIKGYDGEVVQNAFLIKISSEDTQTNIVMHPDTKLYCSVYPDDDICKSYCELHPDDDDCYCKANPNASRCKVAEDNPNICDLYPNSDTCFCEKYPMSSRCNAVNLNAAVIYYDYNKPLENYTKYTLPSNWAGYAALIEEIKSSDFADSKLTVTLTQKDLADMRLWISENPNKIGTGEMIERFRYIFSGDL